MPLTLPGGCAAYPPGGLRPQLSQHGAPLLRSCWTRALCCAVFFDQDAKAKDHRAGWSSGGPLGPARLLAGGP